jgi:hypothetical protein
MSKNPCPAGRASCAEGGRSHASLNLRPALPLVGINLVADQREAQPKGYTHHEVVASRAVSPSGRTYLLAGAPQA